MDKFLEYGLPERLITDNGTNFRSRLVEELCRLMKISRLFTSPYHPQFDGLCERYNRTLAAMLRAFVAENQSDWDQYLPYVMHAYRAAPQESTKESPFFLMFFRPCRAPLDIMLDDSERQVPQPDQLQATKTEAIRKLHEAFRVVKGRLVQAREEQKKTHDKRSKPREFQVGDEVYLLDERVPEGAGRKLHRPWKPGYRVIKRTSPLNYLVEHPSRRGKVQRVHAERLKAAIPEMVWPEEKKPTVTEPHRTHPPETALDMWLEEEKNRYQPFSSEPFLLLGDSDEEETGTSSSTPQADPSRGDRVVSGQNVQGQGDEGQITTGTMERNQGERETGLRRSERIMARRRAGEPEPKYN